MIPEDAAATAAAYCRSVARRKQIVRRIKTVRRWGEVVLVKPELPQQIVF
jgi:hypothetical protein